MKVRAEFDNADNALFPNQFVNAHLLLNTLHDVVEVPTAAIQRGAPGTYVYVINSDNTVSVRPIKIGPIDGPMAAVSSGLSAGERVVVDGTDRLRDGMRVTIPDAGNQAQAPAGTQAPGAGARTAPAAPAARSQGSGRSHNRGDGQ